MSFKLGSKRGNEERKLKIGGSSDRIAGVKIEQVNLPNGVLGEAHQEGTIHVSDKIEKDSEQYRRVVAHEMKHITHMKLGRVKYDDTSITFDGITYPRKDGYVHFDGQWLPEGDTNFPWEFKD